MSQYQMVTRIYDDVVQDLFVQVNVSEDHRGKKYTHMFGREFTKAGEIQRISWIRAGHNTAIIRLVDKVTNWYKQNAPAALKT